MRVDVAKLKAVVVTEICEVLYQKEQDVGDFMGDVVRGITLPSLIVSIISWLATQQEILSFRNFRDVLILGLHGVIQAFIIKNVAVVGMFL